jgi:uncharacterized protein (DUF885 family)
MLEYLVELNEDVMSEAGDYFITLPDQPLEIVRVHGLVLMNGAMPLGILDKTVDEWIEQEKAS